MSEPTKMNYQSENAWLLETWCLNEKKCILKKNIDNIWIYTIFILYFVLGISNLDMISSIYTGDMHRWYVNTIPSYLRDLNIHRFCYVTIKV